MEGVDIHGDSHTYHRMVEFTEDYVRRNTSADGTVSISATFDNLIAGNYMASEEVTGRYRLSSISNVVSGIVSGGSSVTFDLTNPSVDEGLAKFINEKYEHQGYSDSQAVVNYIKAK